jgi:hypothetical protein
MKNNKFTGLLNSVSTAEEPAAKPSAAAPVKKSDNRRSQPATNNILPTAKAPTTQTAAAEPEAESRPKTGRPSGKRSSSDYKQVTAYIDLNTYKKVKVRLFEQDEKQEFSELVDTLLKDWLK